MGASVGKNKGFVSEINVTPFVDVMLVLLIIFMVTAPMMTEGLDLSLPETQAVKVLPTDSDHLVLTITKDGRMYLESQPITLESLDSVLRQTVTAQNKQLFLQADSGLPYGLVIDIMGRATAAGVNRLSVIATPPREDAAPAATTKPDAAMPRPDAATPRPDAATPRPDAAMRPGR